MKKVLFLAVLLLISCGQPPAQPATPPQISVDATLKPPVAGLPALEDGIPRPVASVTGEDGTPAAFVSNELWISSDNPSELEALLARWNGKVIGSFKPADFGLTGLSNQYLVRINTTSADSGKLGQDLQKLDPKASGNYKVSSQDGLQLLSASAREAANGATVGLNWVGQGDQFSDQTSREAPTGQSIGGVAYNPNAFSWPSHSSGGSSPQNIGVAQAWRALELAGKLNNKIGLAVLDGGFKPDADVRPGWTAISNIPTVLNPINTSNFMSCSGGSDCPWHGTNVVSAAMALPDNNYGAAGPAGPVADPVMVLTFGDMFSSITAIGEARLAGAKIANMSYHIPVPWYLGWSVLPFEVATKTFRLTGMLLFAAAGNDGKDVDAEGCTLGACWERTWYTPCENAGVICVGGLRANSTSRADNSNYGKDQVDIFAPYTLLVGPDPDAPDNTARSINGTSFSSPFAAGVAALIWAANPSQSANQVEDILLNSAHKPGTEKVNRYVNALAGVLQVLGNIPPALTLPFSTTESPINVSQTLSVDVFDFEDAFPCCTVRWSSDRDGNLGSGRQISHTFTTPGSRTITVTATDSGNASSTARMVLNAVNYAPVASISRPQAGDQVFRGSRVILRGRATDRNEAQDLLACSRLVWTSSVAGDGGFPLTGCELEATFASNGPRTLTLTATDPQGLSSVRQVNLTVVTPPANLPPVVNITNPKNFASLGRDQAITLSATATDPEGSTPLTYAWTAKVNNGAPQAIGSGLSAPWTPSQSINFSFEGTYLVELRFSATDPQGNTGSDFVTLEFVVIN